MTQEGGPGFDNQTVSRQSCFGRQQFKSGDVAVDGAQFVAAVLREDFQQRRLAQQAAAIQRGIRGQDRDLEAVSLAQAFPAGDALDQQRIGPERGRQAQQARVLRMAGQQRAQCGCGAGDVSTHCLSCYSMLAN